MLSKLRVVSLVSVYLILPAFGWSSTALAQSWYKADIHLYAHCADISYSAAQLLGLMKQEGINVGSVLVWGGGPDSLRLDSVHFRGQEDDPVSEPNYIVQVKFISSIAICPRATLGCDLNRSILWGFWQNTV